MAAIVDTVMSTILQGAVSFVKAFLEESGLGNLNLGSWEINYSSEIPELFSGHAFLKNFLFNGLSDFVVHDLKFVSASSKVCFDISIPKLVLSFGKTGGHMKVFGYEVDGDLKGKINIIQPRIQGEIFVTMTPDFSYTLDHVDVNFFLESIKSNLKVNINKTSYTKSVNEFLNKTVPAFIEKYKEQLNELLNAIIKFVTSSSPTLNRLIAINDLF